jgi:hypothetical protein
MKKSVFYPTVMDEYHLSFMGTIILVYPFVCFSRHFSFCSTRYSKNVCKKENNNNNTNNTNNNNNIIIIIKIKMNKI